VFAVFEASNSACATTSTKQIGGGLAVHHTRGDCIGVRLVGVSDTAASVTLNRISVLHRMRGLVSCDEQTRVLIRKPDVAAKREPLGTELHGRVARGFIRVGRCGERPTERRLDLTAMRERCRRSGQAL
jgi:hypothetical protein